MIGLSRMAFMAVALLATPALAASGGLIEPKMHLPPSTLAGEVRVAVTFDACEGKTDERILQTLVGNRIPATIFVTGRWLKHNATAFAIMRANPDLFEIEDHGANHVPAIDEPIRVYGLKAAGSADAVKAEVMGGEVAIRAAGAPAPRWFRGATAKYTASSMEEIRRLGLSVAGYSINGDGGSLLGAAATERHIASAKDTDIVIAHINQPTHAAGEGVVKGLLDLKAKGVTFIRLEDVAFGKPVPAVY